VTQFNMQYSLSEAYLCHESYQLALGKLQAKILWSILVFKKKKEITNPHGYCCFVLVSAKILKPSITSPFYSLKRWTFSSRFNLLCFLLWSRNKTI